MSIPQTGTALRYYRSRQKTTPTIVSDHKQLNVSRVRAVMEGLEQTPSATDNLERHMAIEEAISGHPLVAGNRVSLLLNRPAAYTSMLKAIRNARKSVNIEVYILSADRAGYVFADFLIKKAAEGVHVNIIYDSIGSIRTPPDFFQRLTDAGIQVLPFNPITPLSPLPFRGRWTPVHRDHRKLVIVDDSTAFIGSANISDLYAEAATPILGLMGKDLPWHDTDVRIEGPAVAKFQQLFFDTWKSQLGPPIEESCFAPPIARGDDFVRAVASTWGQRNRDNYFAYLAAINSAQRSIHLTCSYFVPDQQIMEALIEAARRGVDVKIILPHRSDSMLALYGGRNFYGRLLKSGVELYRRKGVLLHSKTAVIDGVWSTVGSDNMDLWSILRNNELDAVILSRGFANKMEGLFQKDLEGSDRITLENWKRRSAFERLLELFTAPLVYWL
ncbi:MAG: phospholipase D-like domain-containing protein [Syntrophobacteraceae bacterium]|nr:phospholipase D-like domain-containing protein [Syntrophobacteraceae bacterium]